MIQIPDLNFLPEVFRGLRAGLHWSYGDTEYLELNERFEDYRAYFACCGLELRRDARGFIYSVPEDNDFKGSDTVTKLVAFTAVWVDAWADEGRSVARLVAGERVPLADLPHLRADSHRRALERVGVRSEEDLRSVVGSLERLGLAHVDSSGMLQLRAGFHRLLDVCQTAANSDASPTEAPEETMESEASDATV
jgi:hypothetical protein